MRHWHQIGIIGTGRVARALGTALAARSQQPMLLWGRNPDAASAVATEVGRGEAIAEPGALLAACDLVILAVADDALSPLIAALAQGAPLDHAPFLFHVSGRSGAGLLGPLRAAGAVTAAIHPAMTFTGHPAQEAARMAGAHFAITASSDDALVQAHGVVRQLGGVAVEVMEQHRTLYHAALCHAANHLVTLLAGASGALATAGVGDPQALLAPLVRAALDNSLDRGFAALSGPLLRGDRDTIADHLAALAQDDPALLPAYRAMALATLDAMERTGAPAFDPALRHDLG